MSPKQQQCQDRRPGRVDSNQFEIRRRQPRKPNGGLTTAPNCFYITKKTNITSQSQKIYNFLNGKADSVEIHGLGASLNRALVAALEVQKLFLGAVQMHITTSTVNVTDDLFPLSDEFEMGIRSRPISSVHITLYHLQA